MKALTTLMLVGLIASGALASSYDDETWDDPLLEHNKWTYWDEDFGTAPHHHHPMDYLADGGVGNSGYVRAPLEEMEPALIHDGAAYWPAYPGEDMPTTGFPYVNLDIPGAAVSVFVNGGHNPVGPPVNLGGGQVRFFIGYYNTHDTVPTDDDEQAFFCTKDTFDVGNNAWSETTVVLGGDDDWLTIVKDEDAPTDTQPTDLYDGPQQWGFVIWEVELSSYPSGGTLGFDEFHVIPEPAALVLLAVGGLALLWRRGK